MKPRGGGCLWSQHLVFAFPDDLVLSVSLTDGLQLAFGVLSWKRVESSVWVGNDLLR